MFQTIYFIFFAAIKFRDFNKFTKIANFKLGAKYNGFTV